jgi:tetraacyldisaccharide 4'-kinase
VNPLSGLFGAGVAVRNALYDRGVFKQQRLQGPVVSIGNLCVGGTGKTPFTMLLGDLLIQRGIPFDVLSRGYGRTSTDIRVVDPEGSPRDFGDEPLLLAKYFGSRNADVKVIVGPDRYEAGSFAERRFGPRLHLLDDGFQHRRLARDFDIVLLAPDNADQVLLPIGRLREPLSALRRADAVVATSEVRLAEFSALPPRTWRIQRDVEIPQTTKMLKPVAFCGIARPHLFFQDLRRHGVHPVAELTFRDHHAYTDQDIAKIQREISSSAADGCLTTIKDMMNLGPLVHRLAPIAAVKLKLSLTDAATLLDEMLQTIEARKGKT